MHSEKSARTTKFLFLFFNAVFFVSGCVLLGVGAWSLCEFGAYEALSSSVRYAASSKLLIAAGVFNVLVSFLGYWAVLKENRSLFIVFFVLIVVLGLVISAAAVGYQNRDKVMDTLSDDVLRVIRDVFGIKTDPSEALKDLQKKGECCGWHNYTDWRQSWFTKGNNSIVPDSCCKQPRERNCGQNFAVNNIYTKGCRGVFLFTLIRYKLYVVALTAVTATIIQVVGLLFVLAMIFSPEKPGEQLRLRVRTPQI